MELCIPFVEIFSGHTFSIYAASLSYAAHYDQIKTYCRYVSPWTQRMMRIVHYRQFCSCLRMDSLGRTEDQNYWNAPVFFPRDEKVTLIIDVGIQSYSPLTVSTYATTFSNTVATSAHYGAEKYVIRNVNCVVGSARLTHT